jgi:hypothetical protein
MICVLLEGVTNAWISSTLVSLSVSLLNSVSAKGTTTVTSQVEEKPDAYYEYELVGTFHSLLFTSFCLLLTLSPRL